MTKSPSSMWRPGPRSRPSHCLLAAAANTSIRRCPICSCTDGFGLRTEISTGAAPLSYFLLAGRMVSGASGAADGRGPRRNVHIDPAAALAVRISPGATGGLVFIHVPADLIAYARLLEIYRTSVARK